jgi:hypothetical protein
MALTAGVTKSSFLLCVHIHGTVSIQRQQQAHHTHMAAPAGRVKSSFLLCMHIYSTLPAQ